MFYVIEYEQVENFSDHESIFHRLEVSRNRPNEQIENGISCRILAKFEEEVDACNWVFKNFEDALVDQVETVNHMDFDVVETYSLPEARSKSEEKEFLAESLDEVQLDWTKKRVEEFVCQLEKIAKEEYRMKPRFFEEIVFEHIKQKKEEDYDQRPKAQGITP